jgi:hypothetical protein
MAGLEKRNGRYNVIIRFGGQRFVRSLETTDETEAADLKARVERRIRLITSGDIELPNGADVPTFLLTDGKLTKKPTAEKKLTLSAVFEEFFKNLPQGSLEDSTLNVMKTHRRHIERIIGAKFSIRSLSTQDLQNYVTSRSKEKGSRGGKIAANTINKELVTFRTVWGWGVDTGKLDGPFPRKGVRLPKTKEKPPFQT